MAVKCVIYIEKTSREFWINNAAYTRGFTGL